jgi:hypothetical protein
LQFRGQLWDFFHRNLFKAVRERYLATEAARSAAHARLAAYFAGQDYFSESLEEQRARACRVPPAPRPANVRKVDELPWQLVQVAKLSGRDDPQSPHWDAVADLFMDLRFLEAKAEAGMVFDLAQELRAAIDLLPDAHLQRRVLLRLEEALRRDIHFIGRQPTTLFQCLWNSRWWRDCAEALLPPEINLLGRLHKACQARPLDWETILRCAGAPPLASVVLPPDLLDTVAEARRRDEARLRLGRALATGDPRRVARAYEPALLDDWPAAAPLARRAQQAVETVRSLDALHAAVRVPGGRELVDLWRRYGPLLAEAPEARVFRDAAEIWRRRIRALDDLRRAVALGTDEEIARAWELLQWSGGHPEAETLRGPFELARRRLDVLARVRKALDRQELDAATALIRGFPTEHIPPELTKRLQRVEQMGSRTTSRKVGA